MSMTAAVARVDELQALVARARTVPTPADGFSSALQSAQPTPATTAVGAPTASAAHALGAGGGDSTAYDALIQQSATANGLDPALLKGLISQESGFDPNAGSGAGARGLTQLMPGTAAALGVTDVTDPAQSIAGGARYLKQQLDRFKAPELALAAYNAGPGAVERFGAVPPYAETQNYVRNVMAKAQAYAS